MKCHRLKGILLFASVAVFSNLLVSSLYGVEGRPNLVYILTDDQGYGDVSALNPNGKIPTPHTDRLAHEGMIFTDAHSSSSVCTPTRYQLLTGRYTWRTHLKSSVIGGYGKPLIEENRMTWATLLQQHGYQTAMIGKWHLGMDLPLLEKIAEFDYNLDYATPIGRTPTSNGFDTFWGIVASLDFPPYIYVDNDRFTASSAKWVTQDSLGLPSWIRDGLKADNFDHTTTLDEFCDRSADYIRNWDGEKPFALFIPLASPHTPILPTDKLKGKSGIGDYGDFIMQQDAGIGRILDAIDARGIADNTIVVFTADNGISKAADLDKLRKAGHEGTYIYRGSKSDIWEGGHRVPHLVRWPAKIEAGSRTNRLTVLGDIFATMADIIGADIPDNAAEDSRSFLPELIGKSDPSKQHKAIINHSLFGTFAIRTPEWKLIFGGGSGGWSKPKDNRAKKLGLPKYQLYNMLEDPRETTSLYGQYPELEATLTELATDIVKNGRSTPGEPQPYVESKRWRQLFWMK